MPLPVQHANPGNPNTCKGCKWYKPEGVDQAENAFGRCQWNPKLTVIPGHNPDYPNGWAYPIMYEVDVCHNWEPA